MMHFTVFQAGSVTDAERKFEVNDPRAMTVGALKKQVFPDAASEQKSVRFISQGRVLDDAAAVGGCGLGRKAHVQVMMSDAQPTAAAAFPDKNVENAGCLPKQHSGGFLRAAFTLLGIILIILAGIAYISNAYHERRKLSMQASQMLVIGSSVWAYTVTFHGLPVLCGTLRGLYRSSSPRHGKVQ